MRGCLHNFKSAGQPTVQLGLNILVYLMIVLQDLITSFNEICKFLEGFPRRVQGSFFVGIKSVPRKPKIVAEKNFLIATCIPKKLSTATGLC